MTEILKNCWFVTPNEGELVIERFCDKRVVLLISIAPDGVGICYRDGDRFKEGEYDPSG